MQATEAAGEDCPFCQVPFGEEELDGVFNPDTLGVTLTTTIGALYQSQTAPVKMECCGKLFHRQCLLLWIQPKAIHGPTTNYHIHNTCMHCRRPLFDTEETCEALAVFRRIVNAVVSGDLSSLEVLSLIHI